MGEANEISKTMPFLSKNSLFVCEPVRAKKSFCFYQNVRQSIRLWSASLTYRCAFGLPYFHHPFFYEIIYTSVDYTGI